MKTRPVFESFNDFIDFLEGNKIYEGGADLGKVDELAVSLKGIFKNKKYQENVDSLLAPYRSISKESSDLLDGYAKKLSSFLASKEKLGVSPMGGYLDDGKTYSYDYLINGGCKVTGQPSIDPSTKITGVRLSDAKKIYPMSDVLLGIFQNNMKALADVLASGDEKKIKESANGGKKGKNGILEGTTPLLTIDTGSLAKEIIQVIPAVGFEFHGNSEHPDKVASGSHFGLAFGKHKYSGNKVTDYKSFEYAFKVPIWTIDTTKGAGGIENSKIQIGKNTYDVVIEPTGDKVSGVKVVDKPFNSSGIQLFPGDIAELTDTGKDDIRSIISKFNSISLITVNGGASNSKSSFPGGNPKLAEARRKSGFDFLTELRDTDKVKQLEGATIKEGTADVQKIEEEKDVNMQQVSFVISGYVKGTEGETPGDNGPKVIQKTENMFAKKIYLKRYDLVIAFNMK